MKKILIILAIVSAYAWSVEEKIHPDVKSVGAKNKIPEYSTKDKIPVYDSKTKPTTNNEKPATNISKSSGQDVVY